MVVSKTGRNLSGPYKTKEQAELYQYRRDVKNRLRKGEPVDRAEAQRRLGFRSWNRLMAEVRKDPFEEAFARLNLEQALNVYAIATAQERAKVNATLRRKYFNARPETKTPEIRALYKELQGQKQESRPPAKGMTLSKEEIVEGLPSLEELLAQ